MLHREDSKIFDVDEATSQWAGSFVPPCKDSPFFKNFLSNSVLFSIDIT